MEQKQKTKTTQRQKNDRSHLLIVLFAAIVLLYIGRSFFGIFSSSPDTTPAMRVTVNDSFTADGWFVRDEITIKGGGDTVKHIVYSGERVQKNAPLAIVYGDNEALELSRQLDPLDDRINQLDTALQTANNSSDTAKIDQLITLAIQNLAAETKEGSGSVLTSSSASLRTLSLRRAADQLDAAAIRAERDSLDAQRTSLEQSLSGRTAELTAPCSGYFSEIVDGFEDTLKPASLSAMTLARFRELTAKEPETRQVSSTLGKMVQGFTWYLACEIPASQAERLQVGQELKVNFTQASFTSPVTVYAVNWEHDDDTALLVLEGTEFNSEMVSIRQQPVEIIIASYTGLRVPKSALRVEEWTDSNGELHKDTGVFILSGTVRKFKVINKLYETEDSYIVEQSATDSDMLVEQDQVIVRGTDLKDNTVVKT